MAGNTLWSMSAEGIRLLCGVGVFIILANRYEPESFGVIVATTGLFQFVLPQSSLGAGWLVLRRVNGEGWEPEQAMARASGAVLTGGVVVLAAGLLLQPFVLPQVSFTVFFALGVTELLLVGMTEAALFSAQAMENLRVKAVVWSVHGIARLLAALGLLLFTTDPALETWVLLLIVVGAGVAALANLVAFGRFVRPQRTTWADVRQGLPFSVGFGADRLRETADSYMLVRADREVDSGLYAAGRRLLNVFNVPIVALTHASNARFFRLGATSPRAAAGLAVKLSALAGSYGLVAALFLWVFSGPISQVLPGSYEETSSVIALAALFPFMYAIEVFAANALTGSGRHGQRVGLNFITTALNVVLNLIWIPTHGWEGAVAASFVSAGLYAVLLWTALWRVVRDQPVAGPPVDRRDPSLTDQEEQTIDV